MATAWLLKPLPITGAATTTGTLQQGAGSFVFNDYAGIICQLACDAAGNTASVRFDLGSAQTVNALMVFGVELLPVTATVSVLTAPGADGPYMAIANGSAYAGTERLVSGKGVTVLDIPSTTARYVEVKYTASGSGVSVRLARIAIGKRIQPDRNFSFGAQFGVRDLGNLDFSARGVLLRRAGRKLRTAALTFSALHRDEVETMTAPLIEQIGNTDPIAILTDPDPHAMRERRAFFGPLVGDLSHVIRRPDAFEAKCNVVSLF